MQQEIRSEADLASSQAVLGQGEPARQPRKPQGSQARAQGSLTARMIDYRSWWNLPASKPKKSRS